MTEKKKVVPFKRRLAPSFPLTLVLDCDGDGGETMELDLKLCFDMNAGLAIERKTGLSINEIGYLAHIEKPMVLSATLWGAMLSHQPEYDSDEGFECVKSYIQGNNSDQIVEALWPAYLNFLSEGKRELLEKLKAEQEEKEKAREAGSTLDQTPARAVETVAAS